LKHRAVWLGTVQPSTALSRSGFGEAQLAGSGFQQNSPAFFAWLGVVPYLTEDPVGSTLGYIASIPESEVVFDYMEPPHAFSEEIRELLTKRAEQLERIDERSASRFQPDGIAAVLRSHGLCEIEDISFREIRSRFGHAVQGLAPGQAGLHVVRARH
jgi:O-methyltransferase involved in polyketide biosynthesis